MKNILDDERINIGDECEVYHGIGTDLKFMGKAIVVELSTRISNTCTVVYTEPNTNFIRVGFVALVYPELLVRTGRRIKYEMVPCDIKED